VVTVWQPQVSLLLAALFAVLVMARWLLWRAWRARVAASAAPRALAAIDRAGLGLQWFGTAAPLALMLLPLAGLVTGPWSVALAATAGALVAATGAVFKFTLITRAAFNQGFVLVRLPVRGVPR
jgi:phenylacetyl-CoA:acceptor oxidoreductase subunit 2